MPNQNPCNLCGIHKRLERYQKFFDSRSSKMANGIKDGNLTGLTACKMDLREQFCENCIKRVKYTESLEDPYRVQYPQDDNFIKPQVTSMSLLDLALDMSRDGYEITA